MGQIQPRKATCSPNNEPAGNWYTGTMETPELLTLIEHGLQLACDNPKDPFVLEALHRHLDALANACADCAHMPQLGGRSLLVCLAEANLTLALAWWEAVGDKAWQATPKTPYPLGEMFESPLQDLDEILSQLDHEQTQAVMAKIRDMVDSGMRVAMPLRSTDLDNPLGSDEQNRALHYAQAQVSRAGVVGCQWADAHWIAQRIQANDGAWLVARTVSWPHVIQNPVFTPDTCIRITTAAGPIFKSTTWEALWKRAGRPHAQQVLSWLEKHGRDVSDHRHEQLLRQLQGAAEVSALQSVRWELTLDALKEAGETARGHCPSTLLPYGLLALRFNGALLSQALKAPPPEGLEAVGPQGHTVWDAVLFPKRPENKQALASWTSIQRLGKKIPLAWGSQEGLLWQQFAPSWIKEFSNDTLLSHPTLWLGSTDHMEQGAVRTLVALACGREDASRTIHASNSVGRLARVWKHAPEQLTPAVKDMLRAMHRIISTCPDRFTDLGRELLEIPMPEPQHSHWHEAARPWFEDCRGTYSLAAPRVRASEQELEAMIAHSRFELNLPSAGTGAKKLRF